MKAVHKTCWMAVAVIFLGVCIVAGVSQAQDAAANDTVTTIMSRKSVRTYSDKPVAQADLETLVKAGMAAPTAMDKRPWAFVVVNERKALDALAEALPYGKMLKQAGAAIAVCGIPSQTVGDFWVQDCSAAAENILLAAESLKLGAVWLGVYSDAGRLAAVRSALGIPDDVMPLNVISIGYPQGEQKPKDKYDAAKIHWNKW